MNLYQKASTSRFRSCADYRGTWFWYTR